MHHSEYIDLLVNENKLQLYKSNIEMVYHDPCELGRGCHIYEQPRQVLQHIGNLTPIEMEKGESLCCGGSLANMAIDSEVQQKIKNNTLETLMASSPHILVTACPLCKKTFGQSNKTGVMDIAEVVASNILPKERLIQV
jgi:Fe-S oxidoreductase